MIVFDKTVLALALFYIQTLICSSLVVSEGVFGANLKDLGVGCPGVTSELSPMLTGSITGHLFPSLNIKNNKRLGVFGLNGPKP